MTEQSRRVVRREPEVFEAQDAKGLVDCFKNAKDEVTMVIGPRGDWTVEGIGVFTDADFHATFTTPGLAEQEQRNRVIEELIAKVMGQTVKTEIGFGMDPDVGGALWYETVDISEEIGYWLESHLTPTEQERADEDS